jgi:hypothetical protein
VQRAAGENAPVGRAVVEFQPLALAGKDHRVIAGVIARA